ncbi:hypothetical protein [Zavarzinella formosa]|uniref:hypothetical protein n=1 Tax=Zavarzinella formosa TaxID=360055 RepID=UPI000314C443|nr:hypothetical protein [Zavarzinella formosa]
MTPEQTAGVIEKLRIAASQPVNTDDWSSESACIIEECLEDLSNTKSDIREAIPILMSLRHDKRPQPTPMALCGRSCHTLGDMADSLLQSISKPE